MGIALQKNYISVYLSVMKEGAPLLESYSGKLGEARAGSNNFSFEACEAPCEQRPLLGPPAGSSEMH